MGCAGRCEGLFSAWCSICRQNCSQQHAGKTHRLAQQHTAAQQEGLPVISMLGTWHAQTPDLKGRGGEGVHGGHNFIANQKHAGQRAHNQLQAEPSAGLVLQAGQVIQTEGLQSCISMHKYITLSSVKLSITCRPQLKHQQC